MSFPDGLVLRSLTAGTAITHIGTPVRLEVTITPSLRLVHEVSGMILSAMVIEETVAAGGMMSVQVPAVDQPGILGPDGLPITFWSYLVEIREFRFEATPGAMFTNPPLGKYKAQPAVTKTIQPLESDEPLDLDIVPADGYIRPYTPLVYVSDERPDVPPPFYWIDANDPTRTLNLVEAAA